MTEETVNINPDGSTTFEDGSEGAGGSEGEYTTAGEGFDEDTAEEVAKGIDPAIYLLLAVILGGFLYFLYVRKSRSDEDDYFSDYDKVSTNAITLQRNYLHT